jgi:hypothetical protein
MIGVDLLLAAAALANALAFGLNARRGERLGMVATGLGFAACAGVLAAHGLS